MYCDGYSVVGTAKKNVNIKNFKRKCVKQTSKSYWKQVLISGI